MKKILLVIDMQKDFVTGSLGSPQAVSIVPAVKEKIAQYRQGQHDVIFTRDTHGEDYLTTQEGRHLPVEHCIRHTPGHEIIDELEVGSSEVWDKPSFGSLDLAEHLADHYPDLDEIELCGLCSDICVVSNALILKAKFPETTVSVDAKCCAGVTEESHQAALLTMKMCQVSIIT